MSDPNAAKRPKLTLAELAQTIDADAPWSEWQLIDQARVNAFADVTGDTAYIHVDPARAAQTQFGGTIAHGLLLLSLLPLLYRTGTPAISGRRMGVNYGYDGVRFIEPVPVGRRVRAKFVLKEIVDRGKGLHLLRHDVTVELEHAARPAVVAQWTLGVWVD